MPENLSSPPSQDAQRPQRGRVREGGTSVKSPLMREANIHLPIFPYGFGKILPLFNKHYVTICDFYKTPNYPNSVHY